MGIFSILSRKKKSFFSADEQRQIENAVKTAEKSTSGEIRVYVESRNSYVDPLDRAAEMFAKLNMQQTEHRNAVLLYIAMHSRELALFADKGIHEKVGDAYWNGAVKEMLSHFANDNIAHGIEQCILSIGTTLAQEFPYMGSEDKNELPDDIVFGK